MKSCRWIEFFEVKGVLAMRNLTVFISIVVGSVAVIYITLAGDMTYEIFGVYLFAGGGVYSFGKWQDDKTRRSEIDAAAEPPKNTINTTINQPGNVNVPAVP